MMMPSLPLSAASLVAASSQDVSRDAHHVPLGAVRGLLTPRPHRRQENLVLLLAEAYCLRPARAQPHRRYSSTRGGGVGGPTVRGMLGAAPSQVLRKHGNCLPPQPVRGLLGHGPIAARSRPGPSPPPSSVRGLLGRGPFAAGRPTPTTPGTGSCPWPARARPHRRLAARVFYGVLYQAVRGLSGRCPIAGLSVVVSMPRKLSETCLTAALSQRLDKRRNAVIKLPVRGKSRRGFIAGSARSAVRCASAKLSAATRSCPIAGTTSARSNSAPAVCPRPHFRSLNVAHALRFGRDYPRFAQLRSHRREHELAAESMGLFVICGLHGCAPS